MEHNFNSSYNNQLQIITLREITNQITPQYHKQTNKNMANNHISQQKQSKQTLFPLQAFITKQTDKKHIQPISNDVIKQCKICLQNEQNQVNRLVSPCRCDGSLKYVHSRCFQSWVNKKYQKWRQNQDQYDAKWDQCQICHQKYHITYRISLYCSDKQKIFSKFKQFWLFAIMMALCWMLSLFISIWCIFTAIVDSNSAQFNILQKRYYSIYGALIFSLCSFYIISRQFAYFYLIETRINMKLVNDKKQNINEQNIINPNNKILFVNNDEQLSNQMTYQFHM